MSEEPGWEFMLDGDAQDFRQLAERGGTSLFDIYGGIDHWNDCPNDDFRMSSVYCDAETDAHVVWQIGYELLDLFNGATALGRRQRQKASIFKLLHNGKDVAAEAPSGRAALLGKPEMSDALLEQELERAKRAGARLHLLFLATTQEDVYLVLKYLAMEGGWVNHYKLMEVVEGVAKKKGLELNRSDEARDAFKNTANSFSLSGFDSRHGFKEVTKVNKTSPMTLDAAREFVVALSRDYLLKAHFTT